MSPRPKTAPDAAILEAAARLLARVGPARMRLEDVAREVGLSPATLLLRFKSKRNLLLAVAEHGISGMAASFRARRQQSPSALHVVTDISDCVREIAEELDVDLRTLEQLFARVTRMHMVHRVADNRYYLTETLRQLARVAESVARKSPDGMFDARAFRDASGIGRNVAIQVLEFFDGLGLTRREGDARRIHRPSADVLD